MNERIEAGLSLGSNQGDRLAALSEARRRIAEIPGLRILAQSPVYETDPVDVSPQFQNLKFLNAVLIVEGCCAPHECYDHLHAVEDAMGRTRSLDRNTPRPIDIDIIYAGNRVIESGGLSIPHPHWKERRFVVQPLADVRPDLILPGCKKTVRAVLEGLPQDKKLFPMQTPGKWTSVNLRALKGSQRIVSLTASDYATARLMDEVGIHLILVGDSLGMTVLGYETTLPVTMADMLHHTRAVARGVEHALVVADMPFLSYQVSVSQAVENAGRFIKEAGAGAVKIEGGALRVETIRTLVGNGIPVLGHIGLTPQSVRTMGGFKVQGRQADAAERLMADAVAIEQAGVFAMVLEGLPAELAAKITASVGVPTIGIGAGVACDGQVLVVNDMLGMFSDFTPKFVKRYASLGDEMRKAFIAYKEDVEQNRFPEPKHSY